MIVQNISKWTTREISKMLMEIQGTDPSKHFGSGKNIWRVFLGGQLLQFVTQHVWFFSCVWVKLSAQKAQYNNDIWFPAKIGSWKQVYLCVFPTVTVKEPTLSKCKKIFFSYPRPTFGLISFQFIFLINSSEERSVEFYNW